MVLLKLYHSGGCIRSKIWVMFGYIFNRFKASSNNRYFLPYIEFDNVDSVVSLINRKLDNEFCSSDLISTEEIPLGVSFSKFKKIIKRSPTFVSSYVLDGKEVKTLLYKEKEFDLKKYRIFYFINNKLSIIDVKLTNLDDLMKEYIHGAVKNKFQLKDFPSADFIVHGIENTRFLYTEHFDIHLIYYKADIDIKPEISFMAADKGNRNFLKMAGCL